MDTPELDKISAVKDHSQTIGEFLDWLLHASRYKVLVRVTDDLAYDIEGILYEYFNIDKNQAEEEREAILTVVRTQNMIRDLSDD